MATIVEITNPFQPFKDVKVHEHPGGVTITQWLQLRFPGFERFDRPTICIMDGVPRMQGVWPQLLIQPKSVVNFQTLPGDLATLAYYVVGAIIGVAVSLALQPKLDGSAAEPDPVYDLRGQRNQNRLGNPIEVAYGRNRLWPSYAAASYNKYIGNNQYQYSLYCLGQGLFDIEAVQIEDTAIASFEDVEYEVYEPGDDVTLFPDNVVTSIEVAGLELLGPNEDGYAGETGPFVANPSATVTELIEVDVVFPNGLYYADSKGRLVNQTVTAVFQYRLIDNAGAPLGSWTTFASFSKTLRTNTPQRFTLEGTVASGRYEVRGVRTSDKNMDARAGNTLRWDALRSFLPSTKDYGAVTLIALKARATNNLNDRAANRFNVIATRKIRTRDGMGGWTSPVATRSIVWAFADMMQNTEYGGRLADAFIDLEALEALEEVYEDLEWNFDFVFEQRGTAWEAAKIIARCGRAVPMLNGSQVTMIRDFAKTVPTAVFNQENIIQGSFNWSIRLASIDENDGLEVEYVDPDTFKGETILCLVDGESGDYPEQTKLPGVTDRTQAYREGLYLRSSKLKLVEQLTFRTGLEGQIPAYRALIKVVHDLPKWGTGGLVLSIDGTTVTLNEPVTFGMGTHKIAFRTKTGGYMGPYTVTAGSEPNIVELADAFGDLDDFFFDGVHELPLFLFGPENLEGTLCIIDGLTPSDDDTVEVRAFVYDATVFDGDTEDPPALPSATIPDGPPTVPVLDCSLVSFIPIEDNPRRARLGWAPAVGASFYRVQLSADGTDWVEAGTTAAFFMELDVEPGEPLFLRVQPIGAAAGAWCVSGPGGNGTDGDDAPDDIEDYEDFFELVTSPSLTIECRTKGGTAHLCGFAEFVASSPPRYYKTIAGSGGATGLRYLGAGPGCNGGTQTYVMSYSGSSSVVASHPSCGMAELDTLIMEEQTDGGSIVESNLVNNALTPTAFPIDTFLQASCPDTTLTPTTAQQEASGCCNNVIGTYDLTGSVSYTLSSEDTEADAIARLLAYESWSSWGGVSLPGCESEYEERTSGRSFDYVQAEARLSFEDLASIVIYVVEVTISRTDLVSMVTEEAQVMEFVEFSDGSGELVIEFEIPNEVGYSHEISAITIKGLL